MVSWVEGIADDGLRFPAGAKDRSKLMRKILFAAAAAALFSLPLKRSHSARTQVARWAAPPLVPLGERLSAVRWVLPWAAPSVAPRARSYLPQHAPSS